MMQRAIRSAGALLLIAALFWLGVLLHEAGHIVSAWIFGARLTRLNVLGLELVPRLGWRPLVGHYGLMSVRGALTPHQRDVMRLWGSLATLGAALAAQAVLWLTRPRRGAVRLCVLTLCFFWLDILTHTLPTLGIPAYLLFGTRTVTSSAEAYLAAVALGMPGWLFQALAVGVPVALLAATLIRWHLLRRADRLLTGSEKP
jgi:hypothetical protein